MSTASPELISGLPRRELLERIRFHHRAGETAERALGFYLLEMQRTGAFRPGAEDAASWARRYLEHPRADKLILLARRLEELPRFEEAFERGVISWTKTREIARIAV